MQRFLISRRGLVGFALAAAGLALHLVGLLTGPLWLTIVVGLYFLGAILVPTKHAIDVRLDAAADADSIREGLDELVRQVQFKVAADILARVKSIRKAILATLDDASDRDAGDPTVYLIRHTALDYLPSALSANLALPRVYAERRPAMAGRTPHDVLLEQLDLMDAKMREAADEESSPNDSERLLGEWLIHPRTASGCPRCASTRRPCRPPARGPETMRGARHGSRACRNGRRQAHGRSRGGGRGARAGALTMPDGDPGRSPASLDLAIAWLGRRIADIAASAPAGRPPRAPARLGPVSSRDRESRATSRAPPGRTTLRVPGTHPPRPTSAPPGQRGPPSLPGPPPARHRVGSRGGYGRPRAAQAASEALGRLTEANAGGPSITSRAATSPGAGPVPQPPVAASHRDRPVAAPEAGRPRPHRTEPRHAPARRDRPRPDCRGP